MGFIPHHNGQRFCVGCGEFHSKEYARQDMRRRYWDDPIAARAAGRAWRLAHPEQFKATQDRYRRTPCIRCGNVRFLVAPRGKRPELCRKCKPRVPPVSVLCYWCGEGFKMPRWKALQSRRHWHPPCRGSMTRAGLVLDISRERVRQLVNKELRRNGSSISRKQALEAVLAERGNRQ